MAKVVFKDPNSPSTKKRVNVSERNSLTKIESSPSSHNSRSYKLLYLRSVALNITQAVLIIYLILSNT